MSFRPLSDLMCHLSKMESKDLLFNLGVLVSLWLNCYDFFIFLICVICNTNLQDVVFLTKFFSYVGDNEK